MPSAPQYFLLSSLILLGAGLAPATAQDTVEDDDLKAIKQSADKFVKAYNAGDSEAIGKLFTEAAEYVDGFGNVFHGRAAIIAEYTTFFKETVGGTIKINMESVRHVAPGVLVEQGKAIVNPANEPEAAITESSYTAVHVKQRDANWLLASVRSEADDEINAHEELKHLSWLIGDWVDESRDSIVRSHWEWSKSGNYLMGSFRVIREGTEVLRGTHRIGWDAALDNYRSWVFDSQGGFAQGVWTQVRSGWVVKISGVTAGGLIATATNTYQMIDEDSFAWTSHDRLVGDSIQPELTITVVKQPPIPTLTSPK